MNLNSKNSNSCEANDKTITIDEAADFLSVTKEYLYHNWKKRKIPFFPFNGLKITLSELINWRSQEIEKAKQKQNITTRNNLELAARIRDQVIEKRRLKKTG
ncbi:MAG: hypothetical protein WCY05_07040 [Candidatus Omnitrophota bacterium]